MGRGGPGPPRLWASARAATVAVPLRPVRLLRGGVEHREKRDDGLGADSRTGDLLPERTQGQEGARHLPPADASAHNRAEHVEPHEALAETAGDRRILVGEARPRRSELARQALSRALERRRRPPEATGDRERA